MIQEDNDLIAFGAKERRKARKYDLDEEMSHEASILVRAVVYSLLFYLPARYYLTDIFGIY